MSDGTWYWFWIVLSAAAITGGLLLGSNISLG